MSLPDEIDKATGSEVRPAVTHAFAMVQCGLG